MKSNVFRKSALEKLATVDQLDRTLKITSPLSWIALLGITAMIAMVIVWSIVGTLPSTVTASGVVVNTATATNTVLSEAAGTVEYLVYEGQLIDDGTQVVRVTQNGQPTVYSSTQRGYVAELLTDNGANVTQNAELLRVSPYVTKGQPQVVVCYVPVSDIGKIARGMEANITLSSASSSTYGHMAGRVINIDPWATSSKGIEAVVGSDNSMVNAFVQNSSVCAVTCELYPAKETSASAGNMYYWSNEKGYELKVSDRMLCSVQIMTKAERPITKLFAKLKEIWGE